MLMRPAILAVLLYLLALSLHTQANCPTPKNSQSPRLALLVGNADYPLLSATNQFGPLDGTENDADNMRKALRQYSFQIPDAFFLQNVTRSQMFTAVTQFSACLARHENSIGLFFYTGHGVQGDDPLTGTHDYLLPVGRDFLSNADVVDGGVSADWVLNKMIASGAKVRVMILDACRNRLPLNDPNARSGASKTGFVGMNATGALIGYAAAKNKQSFEEPWSGAGIYTSQLIQAMRENAHLPLELVFKRAGEKAARLAKFLGRQQNPWFSGGVQGDFCLKPCDMGGGGSQQDAAMAKQLATIQAQIDALRQAQQTPDFTAELEACAAHLAANRLTPGAGDNAFDCYKNVLRQVPGNTRALRGLAAIENACVKLIENKITAGNFSLAKTYIGRLQNVNPEHRDLTRLRQAVDLEVSQNAPPDGTAKRELDHARKGRSQSMRITVAGKTYIAYDNGTTLDTQTGLLWMRCLLGQTWTGSTCSGKAKDFAWDAARKQTASFAGHDDWRIASIEELRSLVYCSSGKPGYFNPDPVNNPDDFGCDDDYQRPTLVQSVFPNASSGFVWSGSPNASFSHGVWHVHFGHGFDNGYRRYGSRHVRLVRGGQ